MEKYIIVLIIVVIGIYFIFKENFIEVNGVPWWGFSSTPWVNCNKFPDWCVPQKTKKVGGWVSDELYPRCGNKCNSDEDCPVACRSCKYGICQ